MDQALQNALKKRASVREPNAFKSIDEKLEQKQLEIIQATPEQAKQEKECDQK